MTSLDALENKSIYLLREVYRDIPSLAMLWSIGKDSTVLLWLARKAFLGRVPFPLIHIDTGFKLPGMIAYRDKLVREWNLDLRFGRNENALRNKSTFPDGQLDRLRCCKTLKSDALAATLSGKAPRFVVDPVLNAYRSDYSKKKFTGVLLGIRADEEGSRSKERYVSIRDPKNEWDVSNQPAELWGHYNTKVPPGYHVRVHPLLDWTELDIWDYIAKENIPVIDLYFDKGDGTRYRSLGCAPCTLPIASTAKSAQEIATELSSGKLKNVAERAGRAQDAEDEGGLETLRTHGYM